jgi:hypothetical protein
MSGIISTNKGGDFINSGWKSIMLKFAIEFVQAS